MSSPVVGIAIDIVVPAVVATVPGCVPVATRWSSARRFCVPIRNGAACAV